MTKTTEPAAPEQLDSTGGVTNPTDIGVDAPVPTQVVAGLYPSGYGIEPIGEPAAPDLSGIEPFVVTQWNLMTEPSGGVWLDGPDKRHFFPYGTKLYSAAAVEKLIDERDTLTQLYRYQMDLHHKFRDYFGAANTELITLVAERDELMAHWKQFEEYDCDELKAANALLGLVKEQLAAMTQERSIAKHNEHCTHEANKRLTRQLAAMTAERDEAVSAVQRLSAGQPFDTVVAADIVRRGLEQLATSQAREQQLREALETCHERTHHEDYVELTGRPAAQPLDCPAEPQAERPR